MKRHFLWILPAVALLSPAFALAQEAPEATVADNLDVSVTTKRETEVGGRKTTETNTGSFSVNDKETLTPDGQTTSDHGREVGFEHKTETEVSKGDHHEVKVSEKDSIRANTDVSTDGDKGDTATVGVGYTKGYNADAETHAGADGKYGGVNAEADAHAHAGLDADAKWTVGPDGIIGTADVRFGADSEVHAGVDGRLGTEDYNVHGRADVKFTAEMTAELKARLLGGAEGVGAEGEAKIGTSIGAEGDVKGGVTIWGIPFDVTLTGGVKAGAEASVKGGIMYDAEKGTLTLELGASAVAGIGANGNVKVEIGVGKLFGKVLDLFFKKDEKDDSNGEKKDDGKAEKPSTGDMVCPVDNPPDQADPSDRQSEKPTDPFRKIDTGEPDATDANDGQVLVCKALPLEKEDLYQCKRETDDDSTTDGKQDTTRTDGGSDTPDTAEPDWREKHPVWAWIFDNVLPEIVDVIFDWFRNHREYSIEDCFHIGEDGGCFGGGGEPVTPETIWDIIREKFPDISPDGPPIIIDGPGHDTPTIPDSGDWTDFGDIVKTTVEVIGFPILDEWINEQYGKLTEKYPAIGEVFNALGIDAGSIMDTIRNVWGVLTGPGSLGEKLQQLAQAALDGLVKMLGNLLNWGIGKLADWLGGVVDGLFGSSGSDSPTNVNALGDNASPPISSADAKMFEEEMSDAFGETTFMIKQEKVEPVSIPSPTTHDTDIYNNAK